MTTALPSSFRDPSGFVFLREGIVHRRVNRSYAENYDRLMSSGLYDTLVSAGLLVPHEEVTEGADDAAYRVLRPRQVPFVSYPYEWCFSQLRDAALTTLRIAELALDHGMSLRDASAYNVQFLDGRPVLIDTLSFEVRHADSPWVAYRQFCQHFLAPLALMSRVDVRLGQLSRTYIDGVPLDLASRLLPGGTRLRPGLQMHVHAHARSQARHAADPTAGTRRATLSERAYRGLLDSLSSTVSALGWDPGGTEWADYERAGDSYSDASLRHKEKLVEAFLDEVRPARVFDLGANTGRFSRLATARGAFAVAFDADVSAVETAYRLVSADATVGGGGSRQKDGRREPDRGARDPDAGRGQLLPLLCDLTNPSPALGWEHTERESLVDRGPADLVLALALVHHLAISNNVPLEKIADLFSSLGPHVVVEFVPKTDPKVATLLATREDIFPNYTEGGFETAFRKGFTIVRREPIEGSHRVLYLLRRR